MHFDSSPWISNFLPGLVSLVVGRRSTLVVVVVIIIVVVVGPGQLRLTHGCNSRRHGCDGRRRTN